MKKILSVFAMLFVTMMAFAEADVGKVEVNSFDEPVCVAAIQTPIEGVCEYQNYSLHQSAAYGCAVVVEDKSVPSPKVYPVPKFMLTRYYTTATTIINWKHRAYGNSMNLRYTNSTYKR